MNDDLISRAAAIDALKDRYYKYGRFAKLEELVWVIEKLPSAQPERKKGKWSIKEGELAFWDVCSECRRMVMHKAPFYNFCPHCGADMRGEQDGNT